MIDSSWLFQRISFNYHIDDWVYSILFYLMTIIVEKDDDDHRGLLKDIIIIHFICERWFCVEKDDGKVRLFDKYQRIELNNDLERRDMR